VGAVRSVKSLRPAAQAGLASCAVVAVLMAVLMTGTGSSLRDVFTWILLVVLGVLLPGAALTRATRRTAVSLGDDLAWSVPVGLAVALTGWAVGQFIPLPGVLWGLLVTAALLAVPSRRGRILARPRGKWGAPTTLSVAAAMVVTLIWMTRDYLQWTPVDPGPHGHLYYMDSIYQGTLFSALGRRGLPQYPMVAGDPLGYHWFLYAILSRLSVGTGLNRLDVMLRLAPVTLVLGALLVAAAVARQIAGRGLAGALAAALIGVVGASTPTAWSIAGVGVSMVNTEWWSGPTSTLGWIAGISVLGAGVAYVRRATSDRSAAAVILLPVLVALTSGSKSSELPILACGFALAAGVAGLRRDWPQARRAAIVTGGILVVAVIATFTVYRGQNYGLRFAPGRSLVRFGAGLFPGLIHHIPASSYLLVTHLPPLTLAAAGLLWLVPQLLRWVGIGWLVRHRSRDASTWVTLGAGAAGVLAALAVRHPGGSEVFFPIAAFPIGAIGSACGLAYALPHGAELRRWMAIGAGLVVTGLAASTAVAIAAGSLSPVLQWTATYGRAPSARRLSVFLQIWQWSWPLLTVLAVSAVCVIGAWLASRRLRIGLLAGFAVILGVGCFATSALAVGADPPSATQRRAADQSGQPPALTRDLVTAGTWLGHHDQPSDVVAVNRACLPNPALKTLRACTSQDFTITFATGLRSDVEGWAYAGRNVEDAWSSPYLRYNHLPFWDPSRLDAELDAFSTPSQASYDALYRSGVRWLLADRPSTPLPLAQIDAFAQRELTLPSVTVWRLRPPSPSP
jgi:hypothetical protein